MGQIPIIGQGTPQPDRFEKKYGTVHDQQGLAQGSLLDSEILEIEQVYKHLLQRAGQRRDYAAFQREIEGRFHEIGFAVDVSWHEFAVDGQRIEDALMPSIEIIGRVDRGIFDPDRMVHEVTHDLLDLGEGGVIKSSGGYTPHEEHKGHPH